MKKTKCTVTTISLSFDREEFMKLLGIPAKFKLINFKIEDDETRKCGQSIFASFDTIEMTGQEIRERKAYLAEINDESA